MIAVSPRRKLRQKGQEIIEFAAVAFLFVPLLLGGFVTGMGLIRSIQANQVCRDLANIYIHGGDFSSYSMQQLAQRLAQGLNLQIGNSYTGNMKLNVSNGGDTIIAVSQIMYVGGTASTSCVAVGAANCVNHDSFVFTQRIKFGNGSITFANSLGDPTTTAISAGGFVASPVTDTGARLPSNGQTAMVNLWQVNTSGRTPLQDQQVAYVVELFSQSPQFGVGSFSGGGQYARYFF
jgi:hypothetical protein